MRLWRSTKRPRRFSQPNIPGLFSTPGEHSFVRRLATPGERALELACARLVFIAAMFAIAYFLIVGRMFSLTLFSAPPDLVTPALTPRSTTITSRADIVDRNGTLLATSVPTQSLCANARKMIDPDEAIQKLRTVLPELDYEKLAVEFRSQKSCVTVIRHLTPKQYYAINKLGIAGFEFLPDERRVYPMGNLLSHTIGYTDIDGVGLAGLEKTLDDRLRQEPESVALSLDLRLQTILHRELNKGLTEFKAEAAAGLVMDVTTGEILAMTSLPDFDPHRPNTGDPDDRFNRNTLGVYEMGSTFKIFNTALALDSGLIKPSDIFDTVHPIEVGGRKIRDFHPEPRPLNVVEILTHSSNLGSARMAEKVGGTRQRAFLGKLGLMDKIKLEMPEVGAPLVPSASNWGEATTLTVSYGHGIAVNQVQMAAAVASILNDGIKIQPTLFKDPLPPSEEKRVVSPRTSQLLRAMMRLVVTKGTAKKAEVEGYLVGGKTGTADKVSGKHYNENARRASFIGVFPIYAPKYLVFAMLDDPKGTTKTYGFANAGWNAAPLVGQVIREIGPLLGIPPLSPDSAAHAEQQLLRQLGGEVLDRLQINTEEDYAARETDNDE